MSLGLQIYGWVNRLARKLAAKPNAQGIMQIPNKEVIRDLSNDILTKFMKHNVPRDALKSENDIKVIYNQIKNIEEQALQHRVISPGDPKHQEITERIFGKKTGDVVDLTGKKIDTSKPILGGKNVEVDMVTDTVTKLRTMEPVAAMKEANLVIGRKGRYKNLTKEQSQKILKDTDDWIFQRDPDDLYDYNKKRPFRDDPDPEDFAHGGRSGTGLNYLLGEDDQNVRVPFGLGGFNAARRAFLKAMGAGAAGVGAAKSGLFGLLKSGKPISGVVTSVPIKSGADGMPLWFKPLVNKVIKEGEDVTKKFATQERQIVHKTQLPDSKTDVVVTQQLDSGDVWVEIGRDKHGFADGKFGQPVRLEYKAGEVLEGPIKKGKPTKTKEEFWVEEAEFTGGHPENVKFEESSFNKFGKHESDFSEVEAFATGKTKKTRNISSLQKQNEDLADRFSNYPEPDDFASGGRVPLDVGGSVIDPELDDMDPDEWLHILKLLRAGEIGAAEGGRVPMFLGGGLKAGKSFIRQLVKKLAKDRGITGSYMMKVMNPKAYKKRIDDPNIVRKWHPDSGLLAIDRAKMLMKETPGTRADQLERYLDMAKASKESDKNIQSMIGAGIKSGMSKESAEKLAKGLREAIDVEDIIPRNVTDETILELEQMLKNLRTKGRKLNATGGRVSLSSGGVAGMLGE